LFIPYLLFALFRVVVYFPFGVYLLLYSLLHLGWFALKKLASAVRMVNRELRKPIGTDERPSPANVLSPSKPPDPPPFKPPLQPPFVTVEGLERFRQLCARHLVDSPLNLKGGAGDSLDDGMFGEVGGPGAISALNVEWLHMQNPCADFEEDKGDGCEGKAGRGWRRPLKFRLPGQRCPGLGVGEGVSVMLYQMAKEMKGDCLMNIPEVPLFFLLLFKELLALSQRIFIQAVFYVS
jgi:hypothetical protein